MKAYLILSVVFVCLLALVLPGCTAAQIDAVGGGLHSALKAGDGLIDSGVNFTKATTQAVVDVSKIPFKPSTQPAVQ